MSKITARAADEGAIAALSIFGDESRKLMRAIYAGVTSVDPRTVIDCYDVLLEQAADVIRSRGNVEE